MPSFFDRSFELSARTTFSGAFLDRLSERRDDSEFFRDLRAHPASRVVLMSEDAPLFASRGDERDVFFSFAEAESFGPLEDVILLGRSQERAYFAAHIQTNADTNHRSEGGTRGFSPAPSSKGVESVDLRSVALLGLVHSEALGLLAQAKSLVYWHRRHRFCANCGGPTASAASGWRRECASCGALHFPRTDPVVIMVTTDGESCLLGRQARFAPGMFSALAGFVEPGETIENAVRREVREETGIRVGRVAYLGSQPWPFPCSLMLGCMAEALSREVFVDRAELEDARWFTRAELSAMFAQTHPDGLRAPNSIAIAHRLLQVWLEG
jgi:NAD+ diphosphatase